MTLLCLFRLYKQLTLIVDEPEKIYPTADVIWSRFLSIYASVTGLQSYAPVFRSYFYEAFKQYCDDGVQYIELRTSISRMVFLPFLCFLFSLQMTTVYLCIQFSRYTSSDLAVSDKHDNKPLGVCGWQ